MPVKAASKNEDIQGIVSFDTTRKPDLPDPQPLSIILAETVIEDEDSYVRVAEVVSTCAKRVKVIEDYFQKDKEMANALHKSITSKVAEATAPYRTMRATGESLMKNFRIDQEKERLEAERKIKEEGERAQHDLLEASRAALEVGDMRTARQLAEKVEAVITDVVLPRNKPRTDGIIERRPFKATVINPMELITAIADGRIPLLVTLESPKGNTEVPLIEFNQTALNYLAKRRGMDLKLPGVKVTEELEFSVGKK